MANDKTVIFRCNEYTEQILNEMSEHLEMSKSRVIRSALMMFHEIYNNPDLGEDDLNRMFNMLTN